MDTISLATQTMFAELLQRCLDAEFDETYHERGNFRRRRKGSRFYWYFQWDAKGRKLEKYVGPVSDKSITDRVARFAEIKSSFKQRREMVRALTAVGLQQPLSPAGDVVSAMWRAGFFRLRGVLIGTTAYGCYAGLLGVRLASTALVTDDADFAQFWGVSENIGESMRPPLTILKEVDPSFHEMPNISDPFVTNRYTNKEGYKVEFRTPNRGSDRHQAKPTRMKALAGSGAQPLRHLDFLIHQPERSVLLHGGGIPVTIPRAEHYAVHKLIVSIERRDQVKSMKDILQASQLIEALHQRRPLELAEAWETAWAEGKRWREKLEKGRARLTPHTQKILAEVLEHHKRSRQRRR